MSGRKIARLAALGFVVAVDIAIAWQSCSPSPTAGNDGRRDPPPRRPSWTRSRNRMAASLANTALRLATEDYRALVGGSIRYGLEAAARDVADAAAEQRYRDMTGLDEPPEVRAERARRNSERVEPLKRKTWGAES